MVAAAGDMAAREEVREGFAFSRVLASLRNGEGVGC
jgi:hypothetical protein